MSEIYMQVTADMARDGGDLGTSGPGGGQTGGSYWISWTPTGGFSGQGWLGAWNSSNVPLQQAWITDPADGYTGDWQGFTNYLATNPSDLSQWLDDAGWTNDQKYTFAHDEYPNIWMDCTAPN